MNFKTLGKYISELGLWNKPLSQFSEVEILQLSGAIAVAQIDLNKSNCGVCWYLGWKKLDQVCLHPDHPALIYAHRWARACPEFSNQFDKEVGPHKLVRKEKVDPENVEGR
jgi:hypothetical protein